MIIVSISVALTAAVIFYPALALGRARRRAVLVPLWAAILLTPLLVPPDRPFLRLLASVLAVALSAKLYDLHVGAERGDRPDLRTFLLFLPNLASVVLRKLDAEPRPGRGEGLVRLARAGLGAMIGTALLIAAFHVDWFRIPFAVEHCTKVVAFFLALVPATGAAVEVWRLLGGKGRDPMDHPFAARTPADFWRRYNRPAQQFFRDDLFRPLGGLHRPVRATLATFAISALIHEYVFDIAVGRIQGYQMGFFLVQGLAVVATLGVKPRGWRAVPWTVGTWAFTLASSVLFFASVNEVVPFYTGRGAPEKPTTGDPTMSEAESDQDSIDGRNQLVFAAYERIRPGRAGPPGITNLDRPRSFLGYFRNQHGEAWLFEYDADQRRGWVWGEDIDWEKHEVIGGEVPGINLNRHELAWLKACWEAATEFRKDT